jgi:hypothetical protein
MLFDKHYSFYLIVCNFVTAATFFYAYHHLSDEMRPPLMSYQYDIYDNILFFHQNHMVYHAFLLFRQIFGIVAISLVLLYALG